jgi:hypothetical protein
VEWFFIHIITSIQKRGIINVTLEYKARKFNSMTSIVFFFKKAKEVVIFSTKLTACLCDKMRKQLQAYAVHLAAAGTPSSR